MARFHDVVGYGETVEKAAGVWEDVITERSYFGELLRNNRKLQDEGNLNKELTVQNSISIVADAYANEHFFAIRYVRWAGVLWTVTDVEVQRPRLILRLGGVYNGPKAP
jgi:hypothetical protein